MFFFCQGFDGAYLQIEDRNYCTSFTDGYSYIDDACIGNSCPDPSGNIGGPSTSPTLYIETICFDVTTNTQEFGDENRWELGSCTGEK